MSRLISLGPGFCCLSADSNTASLQYKRNNTQF